MNNFNILYILPPCGICMDSLLEDIVQTDCGHLFHFACIINNFKYRKECPYCKTELYMMNLTKIKYKVEIERDVIFIFK